MVTVSLVDLAELAAVEPDEDLFALMAAHCPYYATPLRSEASSSRRDGATYKGRIRVRASSMCRGVSC